MKLVVYCSLIFLTQFLTVEYLKYREMEEINTFIKGAICDDQCLGRCLYIHGVPGTGKVEYCCFILNRNISLI